MKKRRLCMICLPVFLWILLTGILMHRERETIPHPWQEGSSLTAEGIVYQIQTKEGRQSIYLNHISILNSNHSISETFLKTLPNIKAELKTDTPLQIGNTVQITGLCQYFSAAQNDGGFDAEQYYASEGIGIVLKKAEIQSVKKTVKWTGEFCRRCREACKKVIRDLVQEEEAGILESLLLGDKSGLDTEIRDLYQKNGIIHVLAISGLHISMVGMSLFRWLRKRRFAFGTSAILAGCAIWIYGILTGFSVSAIRATVMFYLYLGAQVLGRSTDLPVSMTAAGVWMLLQQPTRLFQSGFLLSYSAVAGVAAAGALPEKQKKLSSLKVSICTWLSTLPITAFFYYQVPVYGIFLNLFVIPSMSVIMMMGFLGILAGAIWHPLGIFFMAPVHYLLQLTFFLCRACSSLPGAIWITGRPEYWQIAGYYLVLILVFVFLQKIRKIDLIKTAFGIILGIGILCYKGNQSWSVTFLNVGQGDGICISTSKRHVWMVDGGSSTQKHLAKYCLEPYLKYHGISRIEGWMISHFDTDHVSGLLEILEGYEKGISGKNLNGITVERILIPDLEESSDLKEQILRLARQNEIPIYPCSRGDEFIQDGMEMKVLNPRTGVQYESQNAGSMVLQVTYGAFVMILTGDVEGTGEQELLELELKKTDVWKVAHHGSKNSSCEELLKKAGGKLAVISCGKENRYGHPHEELLQRLKDSGYEIVRTDQDGMVRIQVAEPQKEMTG